MQKAIEILKELESYYREKGKIIQAATVKTAILKLHAYDKKAKKEVPAQAGNPRHHAVCFSGGETYTSVRPNQAADNKPSSAKTDDFWLRAG